jgi:hypothetical protein
MKLPEYNRVSVRGLSTIGLLGVALVVLISIEQISVWWMVLAVICILSGIGAENKK